MKRVARRFKRLVRCKHCNMHTEDQSPFGVWVATQPELESTHFVNEDIDWVLHRYKPMVDGVGTRDVNFMMFIEVKTFGAVPTNSHLESLWFTHQFFAYSRGKRELMLPGVKSKRTVWHYGCSLLRLFDDSPRGRVEWGRFDRNGDVSYKTISEQQVRELFRFDIDPDSLKPLTTRRHHKTREIVALEKTPLGFFRPHRTVKRS